MSAERFLYGSDAMFFQQHGGKKSCSKPRPQTVSNAMHLIFGLGNCGVSGGLMYLGINALRLGQKTVSLGVVGSCPPAAAIAMGIVLAAIGLCLLGLLIRDKAYSYQLHRLKSYR